MRLALVFSEFCGHDVSTTQYQRLFPDATVYVLRDDNVADVFTKPGDAKHPRWGWRMHDYWQARQMLNVNADIVMAFDNDMRIVSDRARALPLMAERFGLCMPCNPRKLIAVDAEIGADSDGFTDPSYGLGYALNTTPIVLNQNNAQACAAVREFCELMLDNPLRAPLVWARAFARTGYSPALLPPQWCVCEQDIGCGREIILHEGHPRVKEHYAGVRGI